MLGHVLGQLTTGIVAASQKLMNWEKRAVWSSSLENKQAQQKSMTKIIKIPHQSQMLGCIRGVF